MSDFEKQFNEFFYGGGCGKIDEKTAMNFSVISTCVNVISNDIALLPLELRKYRDINNISKGSDIDIKHPVSHIFKYKANDLVVSYNFKEVLMSDLLLSGNTYWLKTFNNSGQVTKLNHLVWENVEIYEKNNKIFYKYTFDKDNKTYEKHYIRDEVLHISAYGNGFIGKSPIAIKMESLNLAANAEKFAKYFYENGLNVGGVITMPAKIKDPASLRKELNEKYAGVKKSGKVLVLEDGMTFSKMTMPLKEAQFIETRQFQNRDIGSWYRVPPKMFGDHEFSTYANNEQQELDYVKHALLPWCERLENFFQVYLLTEQNIKDGYFIQFDFNKLLKGDSKTMAEINHLRRQDGVITANEWRTQEGLNPREEKEADKLIINGNMIPIEDVGVDKYANKKQNNV